MEPFELRSIVYNSIQVRFISITNHIKTKRLSKSFGRRLANNYGVLTSIAHKLKQTDEKKTKDHKGHIKKTKVI